MLLYLQVVVSHYTQERYDSVEYCQAAKRWRHVTCALLQDEILKGTFLLLLPSSSSTIPRVFIVWVITCHLKDNTIFRSIYWKKTLTANILPLYCTVYIMITKQWAYFVEEKNKVDSKGNKKCQESEVVEVSRQVVLWKITMSYW